MGTEPRIRRSSSCPLCLWFNTYCPSITHATRKPVVERPTLLNAESRKPSRDALRCRSATAPTRSSRMLVGVSHGINHRLGRPARGRGGSGTPFTHIAQDVVQPEGVGFLLPDRMQTTTTVGAIPSVLTKLLEIVSEIAPRLGPGTASVLPFRRRRQAILTAIQSLRRPRQKGDGRTQWPRPKTPCRQVGGEPPLAIRRAFFLVAAAPGDSAPMIRWYSPWVTSKTAM